MKKMTLSIIFLLIIFIFSFQSVSAPIEYSKIVFKENVRIHYYYALEYTLVKNPIGIGCAPFSDFEYIRNEEMMEKLRNYLNEKAKEKDSIIASVGGPPLIIEIRIIDPIIIKHNLRDSIVRYNGIYLEWELIGDQSTLFEDDFGTFDAINSLPNSSNMQKIKNMIKKFIKLNYNDMTENVCRQDIDFENEEVGDMLALAEITSDDIMLLDKNDKILYKGISDCYNYYFKKFPTTLNDPEGEKMHPNHLDTTNDYLELFYFGKRIIISKNETKSIWRDRTEEIAVFYQIFKKIEKMKVEIEKMKNDIKTHYSKLESPDISLLAESYRKYSTELLKMEDFLNGSEAYHQENKRIIFEYDLDNLMLDDIPYEIRNLRPEVSALEKHYDLIKDLYFVGANEEALNRSYDANKLSEKVFYLTIGVIILSIISVIFFAVSICYSRKSIQESKRQNQENKNQSLILQRIEEGIDKLIENSKKLPLEVNRVTFGKPAKPITKKEKEKALKSLTKKKGLKL